MPIGALELVGPVMSRLVERRPRSVLDLGIGFGFYGAAVRQWLDLGVRPWATRLVGVEGWAGYRSPCWDLYDAVHIAELGEWLSRDAEPFDAILLLDVIEHFDLDHGAAVAEAARKRLSQSGLLLIGTPAIWMPQGACYGNEFERHRSLWTAELLTDLGCEILVNGSMLLGVVPRIEQRALESTSGRTTT